MAFTYLLFGAIGLAAILLVARLFAKADPATLAAVLKWVGGTLAALLILYLVVRGYGPAAMMMSALAYMMLRRRLSRRPSVVGLFGGGFPGRARPSPGQSSEVETAYLRMTLDHDSGDMTGNVRQGSFAGRELSSLGLDELLTVLAECARADQQSVPLLEAYLDRGPHADWRDRMDARERAAGSVGKAGMTAEEAREILGVGADATPEEIKGAHRRLMQTNHPDRGGSTYLAAKINLAKEVLLGA